MPSAVHSLPVSQCLLLLASAMLLSLGLNALMIRIGPWLGLMDQPGERRIHVKEIPRAGGIAVWLAFAITAMAGREWFPSLFTGGNGQCLNAFLASSLLLVAVGFVDDRGGIPPLVKLSGQIAASLLFFMLKPGDGGHLFGYAIPPLLDALIFVGWSVLLINAFNLIDGLDGLCGGLSCVSLVFIAVMSMAESSYSNALLVGLMAAAIIGFLRFNLNPARIFLGDAGSMMLGLFLASSATQTSGRRALIGSLLLPVAIAGIPLLDVMLAVWRRSVRRALGPGEGDKPSGIFSPDKDHLHHRLLSRGLSQPKVALLMQGLAALMAFLCFAPVFLGTRGLAVTITGFTLMALFGFRHLARIELTHTGSLVHLVVKRRNTSRSWRHWYFAYDVAALALSAAAGVAIESNLGTRAHDFDWSLRFAATYVTCQMIALHVMQTYRRVWTRSVLADFVKVAAGLAVGSLIACVLVQAARGELAWSAARAGWISVGISTWLILGPRALPDILRELAMDSQHRQLSRHERDGLQLLVYGAGDLGNLFVKYLKFASPSEQRGFKIAGFIDDSSDLPGRLVNGFKVHGGLSNLPAITERYPIHGIMLAVRDFPDAKLQELLRTAERLRLFVYVWDADLAPRRILSGPFPVVSTEAGPAAILEPLAPHGKLKEKH